LRARQLFRQAAKLDPKLPEAQLWLGRVNAGLGFYGWTEDPKGDLREGMQAALNAVQLDERNPYSHYALAIVSVVSGELEQAIRAAEKANEISPSFALGHFVLGMARLFSGRPEAAIEPLEHGLRLNPFDPQNFVWFQTLAFAEYFAGNRVLAPFHPLHKRLVPFGFWSGPFWFSVANSNRSIGGWLNLGTDRAHMALLGILRAQYVNQRR
jgi:tetratricopeptide (TPR) repeat protein